ncbi:MAG: S-layer homology domain-containing protein [Oscillospiraceae bacterium]|nr:S-layer homology domain-containing protein [Oscillospiraceae bacterium]
MKKRLLSMVLFLALSIGMFATMTQGAGTENGARVSTVLFYVTNSNGEQILVSQIPLSQMTADLDAGTINNTLHNYSLLDGYVTTVHQEAQGFTVNEFVDYACMQSSVEALQSLNLTFQGTDKIAFWEIDQTDYSDLDTYTYQDLYGEQRYNFPDLYKYWDYTAQDYVDPNGKMTRTQVIDTIFNQGQSESFLLAVRSFSQRYTATGDKVEAGDYNMENYWNDLGYLDSQRAIRIMKPMTKDELYNKTSTVSDTRYWVANILLDMENRPVIASQGQVAQPTATMTEDDNNYYVTLSCTTDGATILYNQNTTQPTYVPTTVYDGTPIVLSKSAFTTGNMSLTVRGVKEGYTDAGMITLKLVSSGPQETEKAVYSDVQESDWWYDAVQYVMDKQYFDTSGENSFAPESPMTRAMLATALYRMSGSPTVAADSTDTPFTDVPANASYATAVAWAYSCGVVNGVTSTTFVPDASITREQITTMFYRYADQVCKIGMYATDDLSAFTDATSLSSYAADSMHWAVGAGLINGMTTTTIAPQDTATRAQVAAMVMRLEQYIA